MKNNSKTLVSVANALSSVEGYLDVASRLQNAMQPRLIHLNPSPEAFHFAEYASAGASDYLSLARKKLARTILSLNTQKLQQ
jgi:hypothetical protein